MADVLTDRAAGSGTRSLRRAYRVLLVAYPGSFRRASGLEILTTLMDAAQPSQRRPHWRDAANLVGSGLRARFALPRGVWARLGAVAVIVFAGLIGAALAGSATWNNAVTVPSHDQAVVVARTAFGDLPVAGVQTYDTGKLQLNFGYSRIDEAIVPAGLDPATGYVDVRYQVPLEQINALVRQARDRLAADGWTLGTMIEARTGGDQVAATRQFSAFWAYKGDTVIGVTGDPAQINGASDPPLWLEAHHTAPGQTTAAALAGGVLGGVIGWLLLAWALRRFHRHSPTVRAFTIATTSVGAATATLITLYAAFLAITLALQSGWSAQDSLFPIMALTAQPFWPTFTVPCIAFLAFAGVAAALPHRDRPATAGLNPSDIDATRPT